MYEDLIINKLEEECDVSKEHAQAVIDMLGEGNTIPFIARYRKEKTGSMSDETLRNLYEKYTYLVNFYDRLNTISNSITEQGKMTDEINKALFSAKTLSELEDLYIKMTKYINDTVNYGRKMKDNINWDDYKNIP